MTQSIPSRIKNSIELILEGRLTEARQILESIAELDPYNELAWLWLSVCVDSPESRHVCLENVLVVNPQNEFARRALEIDRDKSSILTGEWAQEAPSSQLVNTNKFLEDSSLTGSIFAPTGGTLGPDKLYIEREADHILYENCLKGEFSYVLTARQMGKSSLLVRTKRRLEQEGYSTIYVDLQSFGKRSEQYFYPSLLREIDSSLKLKSSPSAWLNREENQHLSPDLLFKTFIRQIVLERTEKKIILFLDEIDLLRSYPSDLANNFFATIRSMYNARADDDAFNRFCVVICGVARPDDLMPDKRLTPFNIGKRIQLYPFSTSEVMKLVNGLHFDTTRSVELSQQIMAWTGGHPYLTQKICGAIIEEGLHDNNQSLNLLIERLFFDVDSPDENLEKYISVQLTSYTDKDIDRAISPIRILQAYYQIYSGRLVIDNDSLAADKDACEHLKLIGIIRVQNRRLVISNKIYLKYFDYNRIRDMMRDINISIEIVESGLEEKYLQLGNTSQKDSSPPIFKHGDSPAQVLIREHTPIWKAMVAELISGNQYWPDALGPKSKEGNSSTIQTTLRVNESSHLEEGASLEQSMSSLPGGATNQELATDGLDIDGWFQNMLDEAIFTDWDSSESDTLLKPQNSTQSSQYSSHEAVFKDSAQVGDEDTYSDFGEEEDAEDRSIVEDSYSDIEDSYVTDIDVNYKDQSKVHPNISLRSTINNPFRFDQNSSPRTSARINDPFSKRVSSILASSVKTLQNNDARVFNITLGLSVRLERANVNISALEFLVLTVVLSALAYVSLANTFIPISIINILACLTFIIPYLLLYAFGENRIRRFKHQLPNVLDLWATAMRSGYSVAQAIEAVSSDIPEPAGGELRRIADELHLGVNMSTALAHALRRMPSKEFELVTTSVNIQRDVGGNLAELLNTVSHTIRSRLKLTRDLELRVIPLYRVYFALVGLLVILQWTVLYNLFMPVSESVLGQTLMLICYTLLSLLAFVASRTSMVVRKMRYEMYGRIASLRTLVLDAVVGLAILLLAFLFGVPTNVIVWLSCVLLLVIVDLRFVFGIIWFAAVATTIYSLPSVDQQLTSVTLNLPGNTFLGTSQMLAIVAITGVAGIVLSTLALKHQSINEWVAGRINNKIQNQFTRSRSVLPPKSLRDAELRVPFIDRVLFKRIISPFLYLLYSVLYSLTPAALWRRNHLLLQRSGIRLGVTWFIAVRLALVIAMQALLIYGPFFKTVPVELLAPWLMLVSAWALWLLPIFALKAIIIRRQREILLALPDAIDLVVICIEAGLGIDMAISKISDKWKTSIGFVFRRIVENTRAGIPRKAALQESARLVQLAEYDSFVSAVIQANQLGSSIGRILRVQSDALRNEEYQWVRARGEIYSFLNSFSLNVLVAPCIIIWLLAPFIDRLLT